jgi:putative membrane protein
MKKPRRTLVFLTCVLSVPTVACLMYGTPARADFNTFAPLLSCGCVLGLAHLLLRPLLRIITAPLGCLTLGLSGTMIDIALIYLSARFVRGFQVPGFVYALLTALLINAVACFVGGRRA